jgi:hypothetical protein
LKTLAMVGALVAGAGGAILLTQCSSSSDATSTKDGGVDAASSVCPAIEPELNEPCPTHEGLACTYGCESVVCKNAQWIEQGSMLGDNDGGGCPAELPVEHTACQVGNCASVVICQYVCANQLGTLQAQCVTEEWQVDFSDPRCAIAVDAGTDADAGDAGDGG